jgi:hypothetical protein
MKTETFSKFDFNPLRVDVKKALDEIGNKYGIAINMANISYSERSASGSLKMAILGEGDEPGTSAKDIQLREDFKGWVFKHEIPESLLGEEFTIMGDTFILLGYKPRAKKFQIVAKNKKTGSNYKFPIADVRLALGL